MSALQSGGWKLPASPQLLCTPLSPEFTYRIPSQLFNWSAILAAEQAQQAARASLLSNAQTLATMAQNANAQVKQDLAQALPLTNQLQTPAEDLQGPQGTQAIITLSGFQR